MATGTVVATLPDSSTDRRLQVLLIQRRGGVAFDLREQHYAEGIGWFDQRALELDPYQLRQLQTILGPSRAARVPDEAEPPTILRFPGPGITRTSRAGRKEKQVRRCRIFRGPASQP